MHVYELRSGGYVNPLQPGVTKKWPHILTGKLTLVQPLKDVHVIS